MKKIFILIICLSFFILRSFSQANYLLGFIVNPQGDTLRGEIDYKSWDKTPVHVSFRENKGVEAKIFYPLEIRSFSVANEFYVSAITHVDTSVNKIAELNESSIPEYREDTIFLQSLVNGQKSLLFLKDQKGKRHFYIAEEGYRPLVYKQYIQFIYVPHLYGNKKGLLTNTSYRTQLALYLKECPDIQRKMKNLRYDIAPLIKLFSYYHECVNKPISYLNQRKELKMEYGIQAGATYANFTLKDPYLSNSKKFTSSVNPSLGLFADWKLLRSRGLTISQNLFYASFHSTGEGFVPRAGSFDTVVSSFRFYCVKTHHQLRFNLFHRNGLYLSGGLSMGVFKKDTEKNIQRSSDILTTESHSIKTEFGQLITLGCSFGKVSSEVKVERSSMTEGSLAYWVHGFLKYQITR